MRQARVLLVTGALGLAIATIGACSSDASSDGDQSASCPNDLPASGPTPPPSYAKDIAPIVEQTCATCHFPGGPEADRQLVTYDELHADRSAALNQIHACNMPPPTSSPLTAKERLLLQSWFVCGAPNN
jgi:uncharacterized membrane protein